ncbi:MAG: NADH-quinone oxidoreductase subunit J [Chloroflexi bacterium]|nr:NADH-quinone oxidoreductase subunit J [Chloroflexota bacterium]
MVLAAYAVVALPRIIHSALALVLFFFQIAGLYVLLRAEFIAAVQVIIYVGAVTVLFLFAIMLTNRSYAPDSNPANRQWIAAGVVSLGLLGTLLATLGRQTWPTGGQVPANATVLLGQLMLGPFILPFEIAAILLLVAMVGAIVIARES